MPFINVKTNAQVSKEQEVELKAALGKAITAIPGKSEGWLMIGIEPQQAMYFKGTDDPCAMVSVSIYGSASSSAITMSVISPPFLFQSPGVIQA